MPEKNLHEPGCPRPPPVTDESGETVCPGCGAVLGHQEPAEAAGLGPDVLRQYQRMKAELKEKKAELDKFASDLSTFQVYRCVGTKEKGNGCGAPVFYSGRGPIPKWCNTCRETKEQRDNRERVKKWRHDHPEKWRRIKQDSAKKKEKPKRAACQRGITALSHREG